MPDRTPPLPAMPPPDAGSSLGRTPHVLEPFDVPIYPVDYYPPPTGDLSSKGGPADPSARILVVDDDPDIAHFVQVNLWSCGFAVSVAGDGEAALEMCATSIFDLVITDIMMPRIDGFEMIKRLRHMQPYDAIPILILSAKSLSTDVRLGKEADADDYMILPFDPVELVAHVRALLRKRRAARIPFRDLEDVRRSIREVELYFVKRNKEVERLARQAHHLAQLTTKALVDHESEHRDRDQPTKPPKRGLA